jgi:hypothetical protein
MTPTRSGFTATFNRPFDRTALNLYDTQTGGLGPAGDSAAGRHRHPTAARARSPAALRGRGPWPAGCGGDGAAALGSFGGFAVG